MKTIVHRAASRGYADHGWLKSSHTFSFGGYFNPERTNFGALRVLNDDYVEGGNGFGAHPHDNMEIISIPLEGKLEHKDSMGNSGTIEPNEIQVMSAGTGVRHSEFNGSATDPVKFLQIWLFPNQKNVTRGMTRFASILLTVKINFSKLYRPMQTMPGHGYTKTLGFIGVI
jgi:redox-sensitive bicupin YhaK (pirin superfamily)